MLLIGFGPTDFALGMWAYRDTGQLRPARSFP